MRYLIAAALLFATSGYASAETDDELIARYYQVRQECRIGENQQRELTKAESDAACAERDQIGERLVKLNYCWNSGEQEWDRCK